LRVTVRHYYDFGADRTIVGTDLTTPESWDRLRTQTGGDFSIPATRDEFIRTAAGHEKVADRARAIDAWLTQHAGSSVASYGVGGATLEWWLSQIRPDRRVLCTENAAATVARLKAVAPELDVRHHDLRRDGPLAADAHLFHRIDTELTNREWQEVFRRFSSVTILVVAAQVLDVRTLVRELLDWPRMRIMRASRAGFLRTRSAFASLWRPTHDAVPVRMHDLDAWSLTPR
jgi:hypothetical protein